MASHRFTDEERAELLSNPYTARVTPYRVFFTLAFKQFVMDHIDLPDMTAAKVFRLAGYSDGLLSLRVRRYTVSMIRKEAASENGLQEPALPKTHRHREKHTETEFRELQERVVILEQQIDFLKKSQLLRKQERLRRQNSSR